MVESRTEIQRHRSANGTKIQQSRPVLAMHAGPGRDLSEIDGLDARISCARNAVVQVDVDIASHPSHNQYLLWICEGYAGASHRDISERVLARTYIIALIMNRNGQNSTSEGWYNSPHEDGRQIKLALDRECPY